MTSAAPLCAVGFPLLRKYTTLEDEEAEVFEKLTNDGVEVRFGKGGEVSAIGT